MRRSSGFELAGRDARSGAIVFAQRFGGALNLNLHFHALVIDGVFTCASPFARPLFHAAPPLEDRDVEELTASLRRRSVRYLEHRGVREDADPPIADESAEEPLLALISSASVQQRSAHSGEPDDAARQLPRTTAPNPRAASQATSRSA